MTEMRSLVILDQFGRAGGLLTGVPVGFSIDHVRLDCVTITFTEDVREIREGEDVSILRNIPAQFRSNLTL